MYGLLLTSTLLTDETADIGPSESDMERLPPPGSPAPKQPRSAKLIRALEKEREKEMFLRRGSIAPRDAQDQFNADIEDKKLQKSRRACSFSCVHTATDI